MSVQFRCDQCAEVTDAAAAVGWVEVRPLGGHPLLPPDPVHLCRLCWARTSTAAAGPCPAGAAPQLSEHVQNRDTVQ
ncbi:hypothetical protein KUM42_15480 [Modestobacter sp. L9-4]|uniref:hypothetical protein n=1 Tax=Modestobacter sp. L9-4 TaxID=2851567 RepID=UPI001C7932EC|nr:hypothetical protein [Modestobacter sp. L9-4]QXG75227.1 hypothetical protein KUM42_15480 [Modestobacter sp. L9-4]